MVAIAIILESLFLKGKFGIKIWRDADEGRSGVGDGDGNCSRLTLVVWFGILDTFGLIAFFKNINWKWTELILRII